MDKKKHYCPDCKEKYSCPLDDNRRCTAPYKIRCNQCERKIPVGDLVE